MFEIFQARECYLADELSRSARRACSLQQAMARLSDMFSSIIKFDLKGLYFYQIQNTENKKAVASLSLENDEDSTSPNVYFLK